MNAPAAAATIVSNEESHPENRASIDHNDKNEKARKPKRPKCEGLAKYALLAYRERESSLKKKNQKKPDMVAFKELRQDWLPAQRLHGHIPNVPIGCKFLGRGEAAIVGVHMQILKGIDAVQDQACYAICVNGKYQDDDDHATDGTLIYTGEGGQKNKRRQMEDQRLTVGNAALLRSIKTQLPVRVLRGRKRPNKVPEYFYDGLYKCTEYKYEASAEGPMVYKFTLVPIKNESKERSVMVESTVPKKSPGKRKSRHLHKRKREDGAVDERARKNATKPSDD